MASTSCAAGGIGAGQIVRVAVFPVRRIARRTKFVRAEDPPVLAGARHTENQAQLRTRSLEVGDPDLVDSTLEGDAAHLGSHGVDAVIIDHCLLVDIEPGTIVGGKQEAVLARIVDVEIAGVIDGEPLETLGDSREALLKIAGRNVERTGVNRADGFQFLELGKPEGIGGQQVDFAAQSERIDHRDAERGDGRVGKRGVCALAKETVRQQAAARVYPVRIP